MKRWVMCVIIEYFDELRGANNSLYFKQVRLFEEYIRCEGLHRDEVLDSVFDFYETVDYSVLTKRHYRNAMRNYVEEIQRRYWG